MKCVFDGNAILAYHCNYNVGANGSSNIENIARPSSFCTLTEQVEIEI